MHDSESSGISSIAGNLEKNLGISSLDTVDEIMEDDSDLQSTDPNSNTVTTATTNPNTIANTSSASILPSKHVGDPTSADKPSKGEDPYDNAFDIEIDKTKTVSELKQVIKNSQKPFFNNVAVKNLKLWKVDISFDEPNEKLSVLRDKTCSVIKEQLRGMEMRPILKIDEYFSDIPEGKHIHIIVEHPSVIKKETNDKINIKVDELSKMILDLIKEQHKSKVAISSVNCSDWERIQESTGLDIKTVNLDVEYDTENIVAYQWNGRQEREQKDRYLSHLRNILKISRYHLLELYDTTNDKNFLGIVDNILPIRLFDKTDAIIVDRCSISNRIPEHHIRIVFELRKNIIK
ncbi:1818_t:CDS:2 [Entrophospora sp. SA101]|nr:1818_t:CDS:2 [Entrophospora sp. SA101]